MKISIKKDLEPQRTTALAAVDDKARLARAKVNTPEKTAVYEAKKSEAERWLASKGKNRNLADFLWLSAEVGITAPDADTLANLWIANWQRGIAIGPAIERETMRVKAAIRAAGSPAEIEAAVASFRHE